jgi:hypothetical protein
MKQSAGLTQVGPVLHVEHCPMQLEYSTYEDLHAVVPNTCWVQDESALESAFNDLKMYASDFFFRGLQRSSYKLYNTWQRHILQTPEALQVFRDVDHYWWKRLKERSMDPNDHYNKQLAEDGIDPSDDLARLSYMQHHGVHTPFLDFTEDPFVAMCFAAQEPRAKDGFPVPLDDWFCIYGMPRALVNLFNGRYAEAIEQNRSRPELVAGRTYSSYASFSEGAFLLMHRPWLIENLGESHGRIMNNVFIERQKGLFLFHKHPREPFIEALVSHEQRMGMTRENGGLISEQLICINFRRELAYSLKHRLISLSSSYDYSFLMPKAEPTATVSH